MNASAARGGWLGRVSALSNHRYSTWALAGIAFPAQNAAGPHIADAAHLGGMLTGIIFVRYAVHWHWRWPHLKRTRRQPLRRLVQVHSQKPGLWSRTKHDTAEDLPPEEFLSKEVDPILDKISAQGMEPLLSIGRGTGRFRPGDPSRFGP